MTMFNKDNLRLIGPCPVCKSAYSLSNIAVLKDSGQTSLLHMDCGNCRTSVFMTLIKSRVGVVTNVGVLTDLSKEDFHRFNDLPAINLDEVIKFSESNQSNKKNGSLRAKK